MCNVYVCMFAYVYESAELSPGTHAIVWQTTVHLASLQPSDPTLKSDHKRKENQISPRFFCNGHLFQRGGEQKTPLMTLDPFKAGQVSRGKSEREQRIKKDSVVPDSTCFWIGSPVF